MSSAIDLLLTSPVQELHPAFDIQDGVMVVGFRVARTSSTNIFIASDGESVVASSGTALTVGGRTISVGSVTRGQLSLVDDNWARNDLRDFVTAPSAPLGDDLFHRLVRKLEDHLDFTDEGEYVIIACWIMMTYLYPLFTSVPFLHALGAKGTGKSQLLDALNQLVRSPEKSSITAAATGDLIESRRSVILFDQADHLNDQQVDLFAGSYKPGTPRRLLSTDGKRKLLEFEVFGPKAFAGTQPLPSDLRDRAIVIGMAPERERHEPVRSSDPEWQELKNMLYRFGLLNFRRVPMLDSVSDPASYPALQPLYGRQQDLWLPIEAMMELLNVPEHDREAARAYYVKSQEATRAELDENDEQLLLVLVQLVTGCTACHITSSQLMQRLQADGIDLDEDAQRWTFQLLGKRLRALGVVRHMNRINGNRDREYIVDGDAIRELASRYRLIDS